MSNSIRISPKHGLNATIPVCFWCGEAKNEVALLGKIDKADSEAPMHVILDYCPCDSCVEKFKQGIRLIGVTTTPFEDGRPEIQKGLYPTGRYVVIKPDALEKVLPNIDENLAKDIRQKGAVFIDNQFLEEIMP